MVIYLGYFLFTAVYRETRDSPAETALVGTWVSDSGSIVFTFFEDRRYKVNYPPLGIIEGRYKSSKYFADLRAARFILQGANLSIKFLNSGEAFIIDYGDGIMSTEQYSRQ